jgi:hypothetical protein
MAETNPAEKALKAKEKYCEDANRDSDTHSSRRMSSENTETQLDGNFGVICQFNFSFVFWGKRTLNKYSRDGNDVSW